MAPYRPPGRSNRSGRSNADNDVFEGLPVKQWGQSYAKVSLAPPVSEIEARRDDKWGEPPMPRDYQLLLPWTQHLLRLARSGKVGTKRKQDAAEADEDKPDDEAAEEETKQSHDIDRGYIAKKWKPLPESALEPEHKHFNFLAKRRRGLPSLYGPDQQAAAVPMRKTKVQKADASGEIAVYEVLVPEGQSIEGEIADSTELADVKPVTAAPGTVVEGVGVANEEGVMVAEHLKPSASLRRNRPPPKKKGGPGRGKKRVTFTNPDGSTYTAIVPNATKIVPQPGQTIKHVAKGEEAIADITVEQAAKNAQQQNDDGGEEGSGEDDEEGDDDDDDREDGELSDDDAPATGTRTPAKPDENEDSQPMDDVQLTGQPVQIEAELPVTVEAAKAEDVIAVAEVVEAGTVAAKPEAEAEAETVKATTPEAEAEAEADAETVNAAAPEADIKEEVEDRPGPEHNHDRAPDSSPELPLAQSHSRAASMAEPAPLSLEQEEGEAAKELEVAQPPEEAVENSEDGDEDLLGNLEKSLV